MDGSALATPLARAAATLAPLGAAARQDGRDLLAAIGGLKPLALVAHGAVAAADRALLRRAAEAAGLAMLEGAPWQPQGGLPAWFLAAAAQRDTRRPALYFCAGTAVARRAALLCAAPRVAPEDEAALLGYPLCCVAAHHRRALALENLFAAATLRIARGEEAHAARLVASGVEPALDAREWARAGALLAAPAAPGTSILMCRACAADPASPARRLAHDYAALTRGAGF